MLGFSGIHIRKVSSMLIRIQHSTILDSRVTFAVILILVSPTAALSNFTPKIGSIHSLALIFFYHRDRTAPPNPANSRHSGVVLRPSSLFAHARGELTCGSTAGARLPFRAPWILYM